LNGRLRHAIHPTEASGRGYPNSVTAKKKRPRRWGRFVF
jgi:hypothetical protein